MKKILLILFVIYLIPQYSFSQSLTWAKNVGSTTADQGNSIAVDASGNVYICGFYALTSDFDPGAGTSNLTSAGGNDVFFAKYASDGTLIWANSVGGASNDAGTSIAVDGSGNVYITGTYAGTGDFDPGAGTTNLSSAGGNDVFFAKYASDGTLIWANSIGGTGTEQGNSLVIDGSGNVFISGSYSGTADFDPGAGTTNLTSAGSNDVFFAKYASDGSLSWAKRVGGTIDDIAYSIKLDASGNIYITGQFSGTADFNPGAGTFNLTAVGNYDSFFAKYASDGSLIWAKNVGGTFITVANSIAVDESEYVYITGYYQGTTDFDPGAGVSNLISSGGTYDVYFAKYDSNGSFVWANGIYGDVNDIGTSISVDGLGNVYITGYFGGTADFDPGTGTTNLTSAGNSDIYFAKYASDGTLVWANRVGNFSTDLGQCITLDASGSIYIIGNFNVTVDFDPGAGTTNLTSNGWIDVFYLKYFSPTKPSITTTSVSNITNTTASTGGNVIGDGGDAVTARGVVWSNSTNPTTALSTKTTDGTGIGSFASAITSLTLQTLYYVRAYATNGFGTSYGSQVSFTTIPTMPVWGLIAMGMMIASIGGFYVWKKVV